MSFIWLTVACQILLISLPQQSWSQIEVTVYGDNSYPPYSYEEDGRAEGIYTRILHKAFSKMDGYNVKIKAVPWKRGLVYIKRGGGFALFPPYHHRTERPWMWPYSVPILEEKVVVFCRGDRMESPRPVWPRDYYGLSIAMNSGFMVGGNAFVDALQQGHIKLEESSSNATNIIKLVRRRVDCYINDRLSILWELKRLKESGAISKVQVESLVEGATISKEKGYLGYTDRDEGRFAFKSDFVAAFDAVIAEMNASGELQDIVDQFLK